MDKISVVLKDGVIKKLISKIILKILKDKLDLTNADFKIYNFELKEMENSDTISCDISLNIMANKHELTAKIWELIGSKLGGEK